MKAYVRALATAATIGGLVLMTGCGGGGKPSAAASSTGSADSSPSASTSPSPTTPPVTITSPTDGATNVPTSTEIALSGATPTFSDITFTDATGAAVAGSMRPDGTTWVPTTQLKYATAYTATVAGKKITFTTAAKSGRSVSASTPISDGQVYGVALPIVVTFGSSIPSAQRAAVQQRLMVTSTPAQVGTWYWFSGTEVHYRPKDYWQEGTKISVRAGVGGLSLGGTNYGAKDLTINVTIGDKIVMTTDNATKTMTVTQHDQVIKTIPISLGKASTPSSSGNMVVISKAESEIFTSTDPSDPYRERVYWTERITWSGQFIHAAPWSVGSQGRNNVSHGCTNMSTANAKWLWGLTHIGDPVIVKGTPRPLDWGNGWTDWNKTWDQYVKGSAIPVS